MAKTVRIHKTGGVEVLKYEDIDLDKPKVDEILIKQTACGLNFIDIYHRIGLYPVDLPSVLGTEAAGIVEAIGDNITDFKVGDHVAYASGPIGAYCDYRIIEARHLIKLPGNVSDEQAAATMLQGMTAEYLIKRCYKVTANDVILLHAAAGGVGLITSQWLKQIGATVIATVGSEEKAEIATAHGCDHVILYNHQDIAAKVMEFTDGNGVSVVYDSIGKATFEASLNSLKPRGMMVSFGNASGAVPAFSPAILAQKGSLFLTRPSLKDYIATKDDLKLSANTLFAAIDNGIKINIGQRFAMEDIAAAHTALEARQTIGSTILIP